MAGLEERGSCEEVPPYIGERGYLMPRDVME